MRPGGTTGATTSGEAGACLNFCAIISLGCYVGLAEPRVRMESVARPALVAHFRFVAVMCRSARPIRFREAHATGPAHGAGWWLVPTLCDRAV